MLVPLSWLRDLVPLGAGPTDDAALQALGAVMDGLGLVVEGIEHVPGGPDGVVLARVLEIEPIEGLDRVRLTRVDAGDGEPLEVACGAWNFAVGDVVPLATIGTVLPDGRRIDRRKLRGAVSNGMLCSPVEVGVADDADGLLVLASTGSPDGALPSGLQLGMSLNDYLALHADAVFDLAIEANRPDCLCMAGIARDVAAKLGLELRLPVPVLHESGAPARDLASVAVAAPELCDRLTGRVLSGVQQVGSTAVVARRLRLAGMRPINAVVDASNYVMLELGQPTHPYDLDRLGGGGIVARRARPGEELVTLDGERHRLGVALDPLGRQAEVEECVIADAEDRPVGLAGIMGGEESEIGPATTRVLLEAALFEPLAIGRAAKRRNLRTDASVRFWRGVDPGGLERASARVCELVVSAHEAAGMAAPVVAPGLLDATARRYEPRRVLVQLPRLNALLGTELSAEQVASRLEPIGFAVAPPAAPAADRAAADRAGAAEILEITVPSFRPDVTRDVDVVEEVARHLGYEHIVPTERRSPAVGRLSPRQHQQRVLRRLATSLGAHEAWSGSLVDPAEHVRVVEMERVVALANPMAREESVLRAQLLPGLLSSLRRNQARRNPYLRLFETGRVFARPSQAAPESAGAGAAPPVVEREQLAMLLAREDDDAPAAMLAWYAFADGLQLAPSGWRTAQPPGWAEVMAAGLHPTRSAAIVATAPLAGEALVGVVGEVDPALLGSYDLGDRRAGWLLLDVEVLLELPRRSPLAPTLSRQPSSDIDLAFVLAEDVPAADLEGVLERSAGAWCEWVRLVDVYRGPGLPGGTRGLAYRLRFSAPDHTLTDGEVGERRAACIEAAAREAGAVLRS